METEEEAEEEAEEVAQETAEEEAEDDANGKAVERNVRQCCMAVVTSAEELSLGINTEVLRQKDRPMNSEIPR